MSDMAQQMRDMSKAAQAYAAEVDQMIESYPAFKTPPLHNVSVVMKMAMLESSRAVISAVELALNADAKRSEVQAELDKGRAMIDALRSGSLQIATAIGEGMDLTVDPSSDLHVTTDMLKPDAAHVSADKMNGIDVEAEELRQQLKKEREARVAAEAELAKRMRSDGNRALDDIRSMYKNHEEFEVLQQRAEEAERNVTYLEEKLTEKTERLRHSDEMVAALGAQLSLKPVIQRADHQSAPSFSVTFPYATKELKAMRSAVAQYWERHTADKRQPTQKEVALEIGELLGLPRQANGDAARKAVVLATAIKPDTIPDD